jgi:hypothetical protein
VDRLKPWEWSLFDHFSWEAGATLLAAVIAVVGVVVGFAVTSAQSRRERRAHDYAVAIGAVSDYLEGPYRVARCHNNAEERYAISTGISVIQGRIEASAALLRLHAPRRVADAYDAYVAAARQEAGRQMAVEWLKPPAKRHRDMNIRQPFDRTASMAAKELLVAAMERDMGKRWWKLWRWFRSSPR